MISQETLAPRPRRAEGEQEAVSPRRNDVFLDQQLEAIGQGLEDTESAGVFRPNALLNRSRDLPFQPNRDQNAHNCCH